MNKELEEAINILKTFKNNEMQRDKLEQDNRCGGWKIGDIYKHLELNTAIETVLQYIENSIHKKKIEEKIELYKRLEFESYDRDSIQADEYRAIIKSLQELLEDK